jgi:hypothetical protein
METTGTERATPWLQAGELDDRRRDRAAGASVARADSRGCLSRVVAYVLAGARKVFRPNGSGSGCAKCYPALNQVKNRAGGNAPVRDPASSPRPGRGSIAGGLQPLEIATPFARGSIGQEAVSRLLPPAGWLGMT